MRRIVLGFAMIYENSCTTEVIEVDDDVTDEELYEMARDMVLEYADFWWYDEKEVEENDGEEEEPP